MYQEADVNDYHYINTLITVKTQWLGHVNIVIDIIIPKYYNILLYIIIFDVIISK